MLYDGTSGGYSGNGVTFPDIGQYGFRVILYGSTNANFKSEDSGLINQNLLMVPWDTSGPLPAPSTTSYVRTYPIENEVATSTAYDFDVIQAIDSPPTNPVGLAISAFYLNIAEYGTFTMNRAIIVGYQLQRGAAGLTW